jgi:hypothetical protein
MRLHSSPLTPCREEPLEIGGVIQVSLPHGRRRRACHAAWSDQEGLAGVRAAAAWSLPRRQPESRRRWLESRRPSLDSRLPAA